MDTIRESRFVLVDGANFSGRSATLKAQAARAGRGIYISPEIYNCLSGVTVRVEAELDLHGHAPFAGGALTALSAQLGLDSLFDRNPLLLSGGEQSCLAILCALASKPSLLAIDGALEQLDVQRRQILLAWLADKAGDIDLICADNRTQEWQSSVVCVHRQADPVPAGKELYIAKLCPGTKSDLAPQAAPLRLTGLDFAYPGNTTIFRNATWTFEPGRVYRLAGGNGAGKSSLAKVLSGVLKPQAGAIHHGNDRISPWLWPGKWVAYHFQNPDVQLFSTTVREEIAAGMAPGANEESLSRIARTFGLLGVLESHPLDLPFTLRKRVALAAVFASPAPWLVLDEPTLAQDDATAAALAALVIQQVEAGRGLILITHARSFADRFPHDTVHLSDGTLKDHDLQYSGRGQ